MRILTSVAIAGLLFFAQSSHAQQAPEQIAAALKAQEGDYVVHDFHFKSGETLASCDCTTARLARRAEMRTVIRRMPF